MKLATKLYLFAAALIVVILVIAGISINFIGGIPSMMEGHEKIRSLEFHVLQLKRTDENFRKNISVSFDAASGLVGKHDQAIASIKQTLTSTIAEIKAGDMNSHEAEALKEFEEHYNEYLEGLKENITITASMTSWRAKLVPEIRKVEEVIKGLEQNVYAFVQQQNAIPGDGSKVSVNYEKLLKVRALLNDFLQVRRREKDFFIRGELKYYKKNVEEVDHLIQDALSVGNDFNGQANKDAANEIVSIMKNYKKFMAGYIVDFEKYNKEEVILANIETQMFKHVGDVSDAADEKMHSDMNAFYSMLLTFCAIVLGGVIFASIFLVKSITAPIILSSQNLRNLANNVSGSSRGVNDASESLATSATQQASSVAETSASIEELDGMVKNNLSDADRTSELTTSVLGKVEEGMKAVQDLRDSAEAMAKSNASIQELVDVISAIGEKTKIIDEIVFQTKLLSFNASVEAERAGEHGRGFAVVAQEVGNLAQMSGKAALEISSIVGNSISQAKNITDENSSRVKSSAVLVERITSIFTEVEKDSKDVANSASGIRRASREQATGIEQINTAVVEIDKSVQTISTSAEQTSSASRELADMSDQMNGMVDQLSSIVFGSDGTRQLTSQTTLDSAVPLTTTIDPVIHDDFGAIDPFESTEPADKTKKSDTDWDTL